MIVNSKIRIINILIRHNRSRKFTIQSLSEATGIGIKTVSTVIQRLIRDGSVTKAGAKKSKLGRPQRYYRLSQSPKKVQALWQFTEAFAPPTSVSVHYEDAIELLKKAQRHLELAQFEGDKRVDGLLIALQEICRTI